MTLECAKMNTNHGRNPLANNASRILRRSNYDNITSETKRNSLMLFSLNWWWTKVLPLENDAKEMKSRPKRAFFLIRNSKGDNIKIKRKVSPFFLPLPVYLPFITLLSLFFARLNTERSYKRQGHATLKHFVGFFVQWWKAEITVAQHRGRGEIAFFSDKITESFT